MGEVIPRAKNFRSILRNQMQYACASSRSQKTAKSFLSPNDRPLRRPPDPPSAVKSQLENQNGWAEYVIKPGDTLWALAVKRFHVHVEDLMKDNNIKDPRKLQPGTKIKIRLPSYPQEQEVVASWYGENFHGRPMANGDIYDMHAATIAHRDLPLGTTVELENPHTGTKVKAVVTDRGPFVKGRDVDLSYGLAQRLSLVEKGVGQIIMRVKG
jgi:rare lipoprotein A